MLCALAHPEYEQRSYHHTTPVEFRIHPDSLKSCRPHPTLTITPSSVAMLPKRWRSDGDHYGSSALGGDCGWHSRRRNMNLDCLPMMECLRASRSHSSRNCATTLMTSI